MEFSTILKGLKQFRIFFITFQYYKSQKNKVMGKAIAEFVVSIISKIVNAVKGVSNASKGKR